MDLKRSWKVDGRRYDLPPPWKARITHKNISIVSILRLVHLFRYSFSIIPILPIQIWERSCDIPQVSSDGLSHELWPGPTAIRGHRSLCSIWCCWNGAAAPFRSFKTNCWFVRLSLLRFHHQLGLYFVATSLQNKAAECTIRQSNIKCIGASSWSNKV